MWGVRKRIERVEEVILWVLTKETIGLIWFVKAEEEQGGRRGKRGRGAWVEKGLLEFLCVSQMKKYLSLSGTIRRTTQTISQPHNNQMCSGWSSEKCYLQMNDKNKKTPKYMGSGGEVSYRNDPKFNKKSCRIKNNYESTNIPKVILT